EFRHEPIARAVGDAGVLALAATGEGPLKCSRRGGEVARLSPAHDIRLTTLIDGTPEGSVEPAASQIRGVDEGVSLAIELQQNGVMAPSEIRLCRPRCNGEIEGVRPSATVDVALAVSSDRLLQIPVVARPSDEGGVHDLRVD